MTDSPFESGNLKILTWNINGIRSLEDFQDRLQQSEADIICVQETKVTRDMLTESVACISGFTSYYGFSRRRAGYSGVATYCRLNCTPVQAEEGLAGNSGGGDTIGGTEKLKLEFTSEELKNIDAEGRCVITRHKVDMIDGQEKALVIINVYCPRADPERADRAKFKLQFYKALDIRANSLRKAGDMVVVLGDVNTSHREIDHCDPYEEFGDHPGRRFLNHFLQCEAVVDGDNQTDAENCDDWQAVHVEVEEKQFIDTFRIFHPDRKLAFTCWNTRLNCRSTNYGTRIDYIFCSLNMSDLVLNCDIQPEVLGSDHCPVLAQFKLGLISPAKPPDWCTKFFREFAGKQVKVSDFFTKGVKSDDLKRKFESTPEVSKKAKVETKKKITSFFVPKNPKENKIQKTIEQEKEILTEIKDQDSEWRENLPSFQNKTSNIAAKNAWGALFKPPAPAPLCTKHKEEALRRKVLKKGPNTGREFFVCRRGEGRADDPEARCDFFKWVNGK